MKDAAEACRRSAREVRKLAHSVRIATERETFQRLADGYDFVADHLSQIAERSCDGQELTWLISAPPLKLHRPLED
jgi:hypothetical protein